MCYGIGEEPEKCPNCEAGHLVIVVGLSKKSEQCDRCGFEQGSVEIYQMPGV